MDNQALAIVATVVAGGLLALQAPINAGLGRGVGSPIAAASISFAVGTATLGAIVLLFAGAYGGVGGAHGLAWFYFAGGLLGAVYVTTALITVRTLGAGAVTAATVTGQLVTSIAVDRLGAFGLTERPVSWSRLLGVALLAAGPFLVVRGR
ncbi:MAG TPA: DMT family transporter [Thermoleophilaceae bacterium]|nr:DMT family transporter [Thermoleophilaceae bacterium]